VRGRLAAGTSGWLDLDPGLWPRRLPPNHIVNPNACPERDAGPRRNVYPETGLSLEREKVRVCLRSGAAVSPTLLAADFRAL